LGVVFSVRVIARPVVSARAAATPWLEAMGYMGENAFGVGGVGLNVDVR
jgi:hypothetical protein